MKSASDPSATTPPEMTESNPSRVGEDTIINPTGSASRKSAASRSPARRIFFRSIRGWPSLLAVLVVIAIVWIASKFFDPFVFPNLTQIAKGIQYTLSNDSSDLLITMTRYVVALLAAILAGWAVGLLMGAFRNIFGPFMRSFISIIQAVPAISWILLSVLWLTSVEMRIGFVTFIISFPFFVIAVYEGLRDMDKDMLEAVEQFRPTRSQILRIVLMPQSVVSLITAMRTTAAMTLKIMVFAELLGANSGIGKAMGDAQASFRIDRVFAWTVILIVANFIIIKIIDILESRLLRWRAEAIVR